MRLPIRTRFGLLRPPLVAVLVGLGVLGLPSPASSAVTCSLSGTTLSISLAAAEDVASVIRSGTEIEVRDGVGLVPCGGAPEVDSVDSVLVSDPSNGATAFTIDLSGGPFAPGATTAGEGTSPEIEFQVDLGGQFPDRLTIVGSAGPDSLSFTSAGINLDALEPPPVDVDVTTIGVEEVELDAGTGNDVATGAPLIGLPFPTKLILRGGDGADDLTGGTGPDELFGGAGIDTLDGDQGADRLSGQEDGDALVGAGGGDDLFGDDGSDDLDGGDGNDRLDGGDGADLEDGGIGDDTFDQGPLANGADGLDGGVGFDVTAYDLRAADLVVTVGASGGDGQAGEGDDVEDSIEGVLGGEGNDSITGADLEDDVLRGGAGVDTIDGGTGDDTLDGDAGGDLLDGGGGRDTVSFFGAPAVIVDLSAGQASGDGTDVLSGFEDAQGGAHGDTLVGDVADNRLTGSGGQDTLNGGGGADELQGGDGNDTLAGEAGDDQFRGNGGTDTASYAGSPAPVAVNLRLGVASGQGSDSLQGIENATGGPAGDTLEGGDQANVLVGGGGRDAIFGFEGPDDLRGSSGDDSIDGNGGGDTIAGGDGSDVLSGVAGADVFLEGEQTRPNGADIISGGPGRDLVSYAGRRNGVRVSVGARAGDGHGGEGDQVASDMENVRGSRRRDVLVGNGRKNALFGAAGNDVLQGRGGVDRLIGGAGNDRLDGGPATDVCRGGSGRNVLKNCGRRRR